MAKTVPAGLAAHLPLDCTTLSTGWKIVRADGIIVRVTTNVADVTEDFAFPSPFAEGTQTYQAAEAVSRTNLVSTADMDIDNVEIAGIFDGFEFDNEELRRGLFNGAEVFIFAFNYEETGDGAIRMFRGFFGDARVSDQGYFFIELRNIMEVFRRKIGEIYSKDCRADLGDKRCRIPISTGVDTFFQDVAPLTDYTVGQFLRVPTAPDPTSCSQIIMNFEGVDGAISGVGFNNIGREADPFVIAGNAQIDTAETPAGGTSTSSLLLDGTGDYVGFQDTPDFHIGSNAATISGSFRLNATGIEQVIASQYSFSSNNRAWQLKVTAANVLRGFTFQSDGSTIDVDLVGTTPLTTGVNYHAAFVKKTNGDWVLFLDGAIEAGPATPVSTLRDVTVQLRLGATANTVGLLNGWIDSFEFLNGIARWESAFTPPTGNIVLPLLLSDEFGDRIYKVTVAGTSDVCIETPDETIGNTHTQGTATLTAEEAWTRAVVVSAVDGSSPRRDFTVTELTPNSGGVTDGRDFFADDSMNGGAAFWDTGNNIGEGMEIRDFVADDGVTITQDIELFRDLPRDIQVGDKVRIFRGCDKLRNTCITIFDNAENSVAEWYVPGMDELGKYPDAR